MSDLPSPAASESARVSKTYNVAVLGAGDMGGHHVRGWQAAGHRVLSVTDVDTERAVELAEKHGVEQVLSDIDVAISDPDVDIVSICLPLAFHAPVTIAAARNGKHVLCEKPLAPSIADATAMEAAVREAGVCFALGMQRNWAGGVEILRQRAAEGVFGRPMVFNSDLLQEVRPKIAMHDRNGNNGPLTDACCHYYLLWQTVFRSRPTTVYAQGRIIATERPEILPHRALALDTAVVTMAFESGDIGTMTVSWGLPKSFAMPGRADRIIGPKGGAEGEVRSQLTIYSGGDTEIVTIPEQDLHAVEFIDFVEAIESKRRARHEFAVGRELIQITRAIEDSIATGQPVRVPHD